MRVGLAGCQNLSPSTDDVLKFSSVASKKRSLFRSIRLAYERSKRYDPPPSQLLQKFRTRGIEIPRVPRFEVFVLTCGRLTLPIHLQLSDRHVLVVPTASLVLRPHSSPSPSRRRVKLGSLLGGEMLTFFLSTFVPDILSGSKYVYSLPRLLQPC